MPNAHPSSHGRNLGLLYSCALWGAGAVSAEICIHAVEHNHCFPPPISERQRLPNVGIESRKFNWIAFILSILNIKVHTHLFKLVAFAFSVLTSSRYQTNAKLSRNETLRYRSVYNWGHNTSPGDSGLTDIHLCWCCWRKLNNTPLFRRG